MLAFSHFLRAYPFIVGAIAAFQAAVAMSLEKALQRPALSGAAQRVTAVIRTDRDAYSLTDTVKLDFRLQNTGHERVYIDRRMFWGGLAGGLKLIIAERAGKPVPSPGLNDALMPPPKEGDSFILIPLDPGFSYGTGLDMPVRKHFRDIGRYSIQVVYQSRLPKELVLPQLRSLPALWEGTAEIPSVPIWISVTQ